jgi:hypothetical protein
MTKFLIGLVGLLFIGGMATYMYAVDNSKFPDAVPLPGKSQQTWPDAKPVSEAVRQYFLPTADGKNQKTLSPGHDAVMRALDNLSQGMPGNSAHAFRLDVSADEAKKHLCPTGPDTIGDGTVIFEYSGFVPEGRWFKDKWQAYAYIDGPWVNIFVMR